jgi:group I intron endonuclease
MICVYAIKNKTNGKMYVGSALDYKSRVKLHKSQLKRRVHHSVLLQRAVEKYGIDNFDFFVLEVVSKDSLIQREQHYMNVYQSFDSSLGYNVAPIAGSTLGFKHSEDSVRKNRERQIGVKQPKELVERRRAGLIRAYVERGDEINKRRSLSLRKRADNQPFCNFEWLSKEYTTSKKSIVTIGNEIGKHPTTIRKWLIRHGIAIRGLIERNALISQKMKEIKSKE